jgi:hypothetical protein
MRLPETLSDNELKAYAGEHLRYEVDMLVSSAVILGFLSTKAAEGLIPWTIHNGLLNTFAIHARNLIGFLYSRSRNCDRPTDIVVEDYVSPSALASVLPPIPSLLDQTLVKAAKQVAHLTKDRIDFEKAGKEWMFMQLTQEILRVLGLVAPQIPDARMGSALKDKLSRGAMGIPPIDIEVLRSGSSPIGVTLRIVD